MSRFAEEIMPEIHKLEVLINEKSFLKDVIEDIIKDCKSYKDIEKINKQIGKITDIAVLPCILASEFDEEFFELLKIEKLKEDFYEWFCGICYKYGFTISEYFRAHLNPKDWKDIDFDVVLENKPKIDLKIERFDSMELELESTPLSIIYMIGRLSEILKEYYSNIDPDENELDSLRTVNEELHEFIK